MKKFYSVLSAMVFLALLSSCNKKPAAGFTTTKTFYDKSEAVAFTNTSIDAKSFKWDFGDGIVSTDENPSHTYTTGGTYTVELTAYSKREKKEDSYSKIIQIGEIWNSPNVVFTKSDSADWTQTPNQDSITPTCILTRANTQGLFNIAVESTFTYYGPTGTAWAYGTTANVQSLNFQPLMVTNGEVPPSMLNLPMVLKIDDGGIYIDIMFTSWTQGGQGGGLSYTRSTQ